MSTASANPLESAASAGADGADALHRTGTNNPADDAALIEAPLTVDGVRRMLDACAKADETVIRNLVLHEHKLYACQQLPSTGVSPLMVAAHHGHAQLCQWLLDHGAPWNAVDRNGRCAGNYSTDAEHWDVVNLLVEWGTRSELILGAVQRQQGQHISQPTPQGPADQEPSTKPDYLDRHRLVYTDDGKALLDSDADAVMMEWERPIMKAHAQILMGEQHLGGGKRILNIGFGMGIVDECFQSYNPSLHVIVEAHPDVYRRMIKDGWDKRPNVQIHFGKWQTVLPQLNDRFDGIFFDTYGEHACDMEDLHSQHLPRLLAQPHGVYSFFNGLAPDNLFFQGVACNVVKLQLQKLGLETEFLTCQIENKLVDDKVWKGVRRPYWYNRDVYYLPRVAWNQEHLGRKQRSSDNTAMEVESSGDSKRRRT